MYLKHIGYCMRSHNGSHGTPLDSPLFWRYNTCTCKVGPGGKVGTSYELWAPDGLGRERWVLAYRSKSSDHFYALYCIAFAYSLSDTDDPCLFLRVLARCLPILLPFITAMCISFYGAKHINRYSLQHSRIPS